ncbi:hypothetical protein ACERII_13385 [Evansella sp. AB-rgal1]|uniref:hypothetical protein n=1 Tax=Evansella sp. AB-rgal1 TaxID=3242696 RepID=UPI00359D2370
MNPYNMNQYENSSYEYDPAYTRQVQEHSIMEEGYDQRQFPNWGQFIGGLTGMFGPGFGMPGSQPIGRPPYGPPGAGHGFPPYGPPVGPGPGAPSFPPPQVGPPTSPPPATIPTAQAANVGILAVDPGAIRGCLHRYTYVWLTNRQQFWMYPVYVGHRSISGYRWTGFNWVYFGIDVNQISSFQCY